MGNECDRDKDLLEYKKLENFCPSLRLLGSKELEADIIRDLDQLILTIEEKELKPLYLVIGKFFIDVGVAQALQEDLSIGNWDREIDLYTNQISKVYSNKKLQVLENTEKKNGTKDSNLGMKVFFDPDEEYISMKVVNPGQKADVGEKSTGDGHAIISLDIKPSEVLNNYIQLKINQ
jgi:hypothetical protein